ncbi:MAG: hypothetical protein PHP45_04715 [Elusimicrobiales bacterium]|nr:hypothetical protein [Elusimicrobiales bacterium]
MKRILWFALIGFPAAAQSAGLPLVAPFSLQTTTATISGNAAIGTSTSTPKLYISKTVSGNIVSDEAHKGTILVETNSTETNMSDPLRTLRSILTLNPGFNHGTQALESEIRVRGNSASPTQHTAFSGWTLADPGSGPNNSLWGGDFHIGWNAGAGAPGSGFGLEVGVHPDVQAAPNTVGVLIHNLKNWPTGVETNYSAGTALKISGQSYTNGPGWQNFITADQGGTMMFSVDNGGNVTGHNANFDGPVTAGGLINNGSALFPGTIYINTSGYMGFGTTSPAAILDVGGNTGIGSAHFYHNANGTLNPAVKSTVGLWPDWNYLLGTGETDFFNSVPTGVNGGFAFFNVNSNGVVTATTTISGAGVFTGNVSPSSVNLSTVSVALAGKLSTDGSNAMSGQLTVNNTATITGNTFSVGGNEFVVAAGSVAINNASPGATLDVTGQPESGVQAIFQSRHSTANGAFGGIQLGNNTLSQNAQLLFNYSGDNSLDIRTNCTAPNCASNLIKLSPGTNEAMRLMQNGNVGIGTASPQYMLDVAGGGNFSATGATLIVDANGSNTTSQSLYFRNTGTAIGKVKYSTDLSFTSSGGTQGLYQQNGGNVGIGTASPPVSLSVMGNTTESARISGSNGTRLVLMGNASLASGGSFTNWEIGVQDHVANALEITPSSSVGGTAFTTPVMTVLSNGKVGVGTTNPTQALDANGYVVGRSGVLGPILEANTIMPYSNGGLLLETMPGYTGNIVFSSNGTAPSESMRIDTSGNVGIGTASPTERLEVNGNIKASSNMVANTGTFNGGITAGGATINGAALFPGTIYINTSGYMGLGTMSPAAILDVGGNTGIGTAHFFHNANGVLNPAIKNTAGFWPDWNYLVGTGETDFFSNFGGFGFFSVNGSGVVTGTTTITSNGSVGIGTSSPAQMFEVYGGNEKINGATFYGAKTHAQLKALACAALPCMALSSDAPYEVFAATGTAVCQWQSQRSGGGP